MSKKKQQEQPPSVLQPTPEEQRTERDLVRSILNAVAKGKDGQPYTIEGKAVTNKHLMYLGIVKSAGQGNVKAAELLLKQGGMVDIGQEEKDAQKAAEQEDMRRQKRKKIDDRLAYWKKKIRDALTEAGIYTPKLEFQIDICATAVMSYRKMRYAWLDAEEQCFQIELSREGLPRKKANPLSNELRLEQANLSAQLAKLTMNIKDSREKERVDNTFLDFMNAMNQED